MALAVYAVSFGGKLFEFMSTAIHASTTPRRSCKILGLIDAALVASLVVMVIISGYENFVSRFDEHSGEVHWLGTIDVGSLKVKVASTIVAISSIHLLQVFLNHASFTTDQLMWLTIMHLAFVLVGADAGLYRPRHGDIQGRQEDRRDRTGRVKRPRCEPHRSRNQVEYAKPLTLLRSEQIRHVRHGIMPLTPDQLRVCLYPNTRDTLVSVRSNTASGTKKSPASGPFAPGA